MAHPLELTVKQAAKELGLSERTVRRYAQLAVLNGRLVAGRNKRKEWRISAQSVTKVAADLASGVRTARRGQFSRTVPDTLASEIRSLREEVGSYKEQIERLTVEVDRLRRALPPARVEGRWARLWAWATRRATGRENADK